MSSDPRYQVFVSSTYTDLIEERQAVMSALLQFNALPAGMELFPAADDEAWTLIKQVIDESDYYLLMIGGRYGSVDLDGIGFTEKEYEYASSIGKPVMAFLHANPDQLPLASSETDPVASKKLEEFRDRVKQAKHVKFWDSPGSLSLHVIQSFTYFTKNYRAIGWVRGDAGDSPATLRKVSSLQDRVLELEGMLAVDATQPPAGAEGLASDDEELAVDCRISITIGNLDRSRSRTATMQNIGSVFTASWNEIFAALGPSMLDEAPQELLADKFRAAWIRINTPFASAEVHQWLNAQIDPQEWEVDDEGVPEAPKFSIRLQITDDGFETALIQLQALGLITTGTKKRGINDRRSYWTLTPWGRTKLLQLRSVRKGQSSPPTFETATEQEAD